MKAIDLLKGKIKDAGLHFQAGEYFREGMSLPYGILSRRANKAIDCAAAGGDLDLGLIEKEAIGAIKAVLKARRAGGEARVPWDIVGSYTEIYPGDIQRESSLVPKDTIVPEQEVRVKEWIRDATGLRRRSLAANRIKSGLLTRDMVSWIENEIERVDLGRASGKK